MTQEIISKELKALILNEASRHEVVEGSLSFNNKLQEIKHLLQRKGCIITVINKMLVEVTMDSNQKISVKMVN